MRANFFFFRGEWKSDEERGRRILLGDNTCDGAVMPPPIRLPYLYIYSIVDYMYTVQNLTSAGRSAKEKLRNAGQCLYAPTA
jgi:hypothetical protein